MTLTRLNKIAPSMSTKCWKGCTQQGTYWHCWWGCEKVQPF